MTSLRVAAQRALTILEAWKHKGMWGDWDGVTDALRAALVEDAMQKFTDVNQELEAALAEPVPTPKHATVAEWWADKQCPNCASLENQNTELDRKLAEMECKPLTEEEIENAYREIWRDLPSDFDHTSSGWIEQGIKYAEQAHGIKDA